MTQVDIKDLRKSFGEVEALRGISLEIPGGAFAALVGPSGCGKSTILRLIAGLEEVTGGEISIGGRVVNDVESRNRDIAMVFQNYALYPHMTVARNMGFSLRLLKTPKGDIARAVGEAAAMLGLDGLLDRYPRQLSGGQRQRVAMARAIVRQPQVFLFDEPLSNLDAKLRVQMRAELKALHDRLRTTTIYVTHDQIEAMTMADIVVVLRDGRVEQAGRPLDLYDNPVNRFVAGFIGSPAMNFLPATTAKGSARVVLGDGQSLDLPQYAGLSGAFDLGLRPEHLRRGHGEAGLSAEIVSSEQTGSETLLQATLAGRPVTALLRERFDCRPRERHRFAIDPALVQLFDAESGARVTP